MGNSKQETAKYIKPTESQLDDCQFELTAFAFEVDEKNLTVVKGTEISYYTPPFQLSKSVGEHTIERKENGEVSCRIDEENGITYVVQEEGTNKTVDMEREQE